MTNYIVSGCPRSGTSLMMQILLKSGMPIATDKKRKRDENNPHGYFEVKDIIDLLKENPEMIYQYEERAIKIIHYGLQYLPKGKYKIIYMERPISQVLNSMEKMLKKPDTQREKTKEIFTKLNSKVKRIMQQRQDIEYITINHNNLIYNPEKEINKIINFYNLDKNKMGEMISVIDPRSYRNRER
ncbi:MAG: sulfotransferase domain-containing protein [Nanobdellota archaeon]